MVPLQKFELKSAWHFLHQARGLIAGARELLRGADRDNQAAARLGALAAGVDAEIDYLDQQITKMPGA